jgi:uncharacterized protein YbaR (Trm112 family)
MDMKLLRCIWEYGELLEKATDDGRISILVCRRCSASFLVVDGIPVMVDDKELSRTERLQLRHARRFLGQPGGV